MDIERINEFIVLAQTCNYQTASEALYTTSSTLSKHISQMEKELGHQLFDRTTRKVTLTEVGSIFLNKCRQIAALYNDALVEINNAVAVSNNILTIAFSNNMRQYGILDIRYKLTKQYPDMDIRMLEYPDETMDAMLHSRKVDFAFSYRPDLFCSDVAQHFFVSDDVVLTLPIEHPLANKDALHIEELKDESFIICNSYHTSERFFDECKNYGFVPKVQMTTGNSYTAVDAVANNQGISLLSRIHYLQHQNDQQEHLNRVSMVNIIPKMSFNIYLFYLKSRPLSPAMKIYLNYMKQLRQKQDPK